MTKKKSNPANQNTPENTYLQFCGVYGKYDETVLPSEQLTANGYDEISVSQLGAIDMVMQQIPGLVTHGLSHHGAYHVYFDKSLGVLQQAKQGNGFLRANVVKAGTNNKVVGQSLLKAASAGPLIANAVFSALSIVTGQYFLSEINDNLSKIDKKLDSILQFLENEKRSNLYANQHYLQEVVKTFEYIQANDVQKQSTVLQLQKIRIDSDANICFYCMEYQQKIGEFETLKGSKKKNINRIFQLTNEIGNIILSYKCSLYSYALSYFLEVLLAGNVNREYISIISKDLSEEIGSYKKLAKKFNDEMVDFFKGTSAFSPNIILDACLTIASVGVGQAILGSPTIGIVISDAIKSNSEEKRKAARSQVIDQVNQLIHECHDCSQINQIDQNLLQYNRLINESKLEIIYTEEKAYIKFEEFDEKN